MSEKNNKTSRFKQNDLRRVGAKPENNPSFSENGSNKKKELNGEKEFSAKYNNYSDSGGPSREQCCQNRNSETIETTPADPLPKNNNFADFNDIARRQQKKHANLIPDEKNQDGTAIVKRPKKAKKPSSKKKTLQ